ncbi:MAG: tripartite tricarboxylate transporter substrate binding protein [Caldimonas sp.]
MNSRTPAFAPARLRFTHRLLSSWRFAGWAGALLLGLSSAPGTTLAAYPDKPIRLIVAFPPGGSTDLAARILAEKLTGVLGQQVLVDNKAGASGNIGAEFVARSAPDGYTLLMAATSFATSPAFYPNLGWSPVKDFAPVSLVATVPIILVVTPTLPVKDTKQLIDYAKANPGKLNMASPGAATLTRLSGEMFRLKAGIEWTTVHYKGGPPAVQDLLGGQTQLMFANASDVMPHVRSGKLRALAVTTAKRSEVVPELPTIDEGGLAGFDVSTWQAVFAPAGTPQAVIDRLNAEIVKIIALPEVRQKFLAMGTDAASSTPEQLGKFTANEVTNIDKIVKQVGAKIE